MDAGRHYLRKQQRSLGVPEAELVRIAVKSLGLAELAPFNPEERVIEYRLRQADARPLVRMTVEEFANQTASESVAPGGGSVAATVGALGAALGTMVANLSAHKRGWDGRWEEFSRWAERGQGIKNALLGLVDADTQAFNRVMAALALPKATPEEQAARKAALAAANRVATEVPFQTMQQAAACFDLLEAMARDGNPASASDAGVGALCARAAVRGAWLNVKTNVAGLSDAAASAAMLAEGERLVKLAEEMEGKVLQIVKGKISGKG